MRRNRSSMQLPILGGLGVVSWAILVISAAQAIAQEGTPLEIENRFFPTGWLGDGRDGVSIRLLERCSENPHSGPTCIKIIYDQFGKKEGWGGIYWLNEADNMGDRPGENLSKAGYNSITFWARGQQGGELIEFKAGDIIDDSKPYKDSFRATAGKVFLSRDWQKYHVDLQGKDLSSVIGVFCWIAARTGNEAAPTFYLDDIRYTQEKPPTLDDFDIASRFTASGWMGDGEFGMNYIRLNEACRENPHSEPACIKITYTAFGPKTWGGVYWQNRMTNWGEYAGEDFSKAGYTAITFWARGQQGGEVVEFKAGDIKSGKAHADSFTAVPTEERKPLRKITLARDWHPYRIDLVGKDLSCVIGGFCWVANQPSNPNGLTFYLDDIRFVKR